MWIRKDGAHEDCLARQSLQMTLAALAAGINEAPNEEEEEFMPSQA